VILPPPVTSDATLDDVEAYLDRVNAEKKPPLPKTGAERVGEGETEDHGSQPR